MSVTPFSQLHKGLLQSPYHPIALRFNKSVWTSFMQQDSRTYTIWGLIHKASGGSFVLQVEREKELSVCTEEELSSAIFELYREKLALKDPTIRQLFTEPFNFNHLAFMSAHYAYHNPNYGDQIIKYAFHFYNDFTYTLIFTWPEQESLSDALALPLKHQLLVDGLQLEHTQALVSHPSA